MRVSEFIAAVRCSGWVTRTEGFFIVQRQCQNKTSDDSGRCHVHRTA